MRSWGCSIFAIALVLFNSTGLTAEPEGAAPSAPASPEGVKLFETKIRPLLAANCYKCHGPDTQEGELRLDSPAAIATGGESGPIFSTSKPDESLIVEAINHRGRKMPPDGKLAAADIETITDWVKRGAPLPAATAAVAKKKPKIDDDARAWWSYRPVARPAVPDAAAGADSAWSKSPIDRFLLSRLKAEGLTPAPPADRRTLVRRAHFDLTGLPPTLDEIEEFAKDDSPDAFAKLIDRLLASPRYGERWSRHWLDVVRFAESDGFKSDGFRPTAWRYRDYVIRSLNADKPYDKFIAEQLAGDELSPDDPDALAATGFLRLGMYEYNQRNVPKQWSEILNDITDVTGDTFLAMGASCARCHDHKFDPILQKDYFRLQAYFAALLPKDETPLATAAERAAHAAKMAEWEQATADVRKQLAELEQPYLDKVAKGAIIKFPPEMQAIINKPAAERTPLEQQIYDLAWRQITYEHERIQVAGDDKKKREALHQQIADLARTRPAPLPTALTVIDVGRTAPPTLVAGSRKRVEVQPGYPTVLGDGQPAVIPALSDGVASTGRRSALARWIADRQNPLTARVMVNRIWQHHFGRGLVATPSDFGTLGEKPSHPELLDWLAAEFIDRGWSVKQMHRLLLNTAAYQQSARHPDRQTAAVKDPDNRLLWRGGVRRLDAEAVRDSALAISGELDLSPEGPSVAPNKPRRSIYTKVIRNTREPLLAAFDLPDGFNSAPERDVTTTPTQALLLINGDWMLHRATALAGRLQKEKIADRERLVSRAAQLVLGRDLSDRERKSAVAFLDAASKDRTSTTPRDDEPLVDKDKLRPLVQAMPERSGQAAVIDPQGTQAGMRVPDTAAPDGDFTVEAYVMLHSLFNDASVRTIAAQWDSNNDHPGWSFGVTSEKSAYKPRNLILQLSGDRSKGDGKYEVVASGLHLQLNKPYYVAVSVRLSDTSDNGVTFCAKDLSDADAPLQTAKAEHKNTGAYRGTVGLMIGARDHAKNHAWDGLIDDVRLSAAALPAGELLYNGGATKSPILGHWQFEEKPGFFQDSSARGHHLQPAKAKPAAKTDKESLLHAALVDFCHVLLNSNEFLYVD